MGRLSRNCQTSRSMPNGVASSVPSSFVPTIDQRTMGMVNTQRDQEAVAHVARHRVHRHAGVATVPMPVGVVGALDRGVVVRSVVGSASGSQTWPGTDWPAQW